MREKGIKIERFVKMYERINRRAKDFYVRLDNVDVSVWDYGKDYSETYKLKGAVGLEGQQGETKFVMNVYPCDFRNLKEVETFIYLTARNYIDGFEMAVFED